MLIRNAHNAIINFVRQNKQTEQNKTVFKQVGHQFP